MSTPPTIAVLAADRPTAAALQRLAQRHDMAVAHALIATPTWPHRLTRVAKKDDVGCVLAAPQPPHLDALFAWVDTAPRPLVVLSSALDDAGRTRDLLRHRGVPATPVPEVALELARLAASSLRPAACSLRRAPAWMEPLRALHTPQGPIVLDLDETGCVRMKGPQGAVRFSASPFAVAQAVRAWLDCGSPQDAPPAPPVSVDTDVVDFIAQPPGRLLSETTSKKLVAAVGIGLPEELLCQSQSQALEFAAQCPHGVRLSLVRPGWSAAACDGARMHRLTTRTQVQQAWVQAQRLARDLGPPAPLGILIARETAALHRLTATAHRAPVPHLRVAAGQGHTAVPIRCRFALLVRDMAALLACPEEDPAAYAAAEAIFRLAHLVRTLGSRWNSVTCTFEISEQGEATAADAAIAVADQPDDPLLTKGATAP